jgi:hypothetical protein
MADRRVLLPLSSNLQRLPASSKHYLDDNDDDDNENRTPPCAQRSPPPPSPTPLPPSPAEASQAMLESEFRRLLAAIDPILLGPLGGIGNELKMPLRDNDGRKATWEKLALEVNNHK